MFVCLYVCLFGCCLQRTVIPTAPVLPAVQPQRAPQPHPQQCPRLQRQQQQQQQRAVRRRMGRLRTGVQEGSVGTLCLSSCRFVRELIADLFAVRVCVCVYVRRSAGRVERGAGSAGPHLLRHAQYGSSWTRPTVATQSLPAAPATAAPSLMQAQGPRAGRCSHWCDPGRT